jgi:hypothetical protein
VKLLGRYLLKTDNILINPSEQFKPQKVFQSSQARRAVWYQEIKEEDRGCLSEQQPQGLGISKVTARCTFLFLRISNAPTRSLSSRTHRIEASRSIHNQRYVLSSTQMHDAALPQLRVCLQSEMHSLDIFEISLAYCCRELPTLCRNCWQGLVVDDTVCMEPRDVGRFQKERSCPCYYGTYR